MSEQTLSEALSEIDMDLNISEEDIEQAAVPKKYRHSQSDEPQDESTYVELSEDEVEEISPITDDVVNDFEENDSEEAEESEAERTTRSAQDRINKAVKQAREYQRRELQAIQYAKQLQDENKKLSGQYRETSVNSAAQNLQMQETYSREFESRVNVQADVAKKNLQKAYESGDPEAMAEAQQLIARTESDRASLSQYKRELEKYKQDYQKWAESHQDYQPEYQIPDDYVPQQEPEYAEPSTRAQSWASKNEWFGADKVMTNVAFAIHTELAETGVDLESDEYYSEIDRRLREELPLKFEHELSAGNTKPVQRVVSGTRITGNGRNQNDRRIELSPSEQQLAKKLGVPFKEYAKQKMRLQQS